MKTTEYYNVLIQYLRRLKSHPGVSIGITLTAFFFGASLFQKGSILYGVVPVVLIWSIIFITNVATKE
jgi:hypothetical protein